MGLSPFMQSLYEAQSQNLARQQMQAQLEQAHAEMARQAVRDAFQQHYQEELLKLQQGKAAREIDPNSPENLETAARTGLLKEQMKVAQAKPGQDKADAEADQRRQLLNATQFLMGPSNQYSQGKAQIRAKSMTGEELTPEERAQLGQFAVQGGRVSPTQTITPQFSPVGPSAEQPAAPGTFAMPQMGGVPQVQTGAPVEVPRTQEDIISLAMGLPSPAAEANAAYKKAQMEAAQARARKDAESLAVMAATIDKIKAQVDSSRWRMQYIPQRDKMKAKEHAFDELRKQNRFLQGLELAKDRLAFEKSHGTTAEERASYSAAINAANSTRASIQAYINPLTMEAKQARRHVEDLREQQRLLDAELHNPPPEPNSPTYVVEIAARREREARNRALWGSKPDGSDGLIARAQQKVDEIEGEVKPYLAQLNKLPGLTLPPDVTPPGAKASAKQTGAPKEDLTKVPTKELLRRAMMGIK